MQHLAELYYQQVRPKLSNNSIATPFLATVQLAVMSKKLINKVDDVVDEALCGMVAVYPGLRRLDGHRVLIRADTDAVVKAGKVTLLSGGGSGHEPAHGGYVGRGMLTAAVAGGVFASPPPSSILAALTAIRSPAGSLMIFKNYTGDRLNFGIALEQARSEGMDVRMVIVGEDCALPTTGHSATGRRGLCGALLVHKVAGAMAERGCNLDEVVTAAQSVADSIGTMSVSVSPCSVPGQKPTFSLGEEQMELGLGIHGEAGAERTTLQSANTVVERLLNQILSKEPGFNYFSADKGSKVALIVNNLGGTSNLELSVMANAAVRYLVDVLQFEVVRVYVGALMTSLEMAGVSLSLLNNAHSWLDCLDLPTTAPGWPNPSVGVDGRLSRVDSAPIPSQAGEHSKTGSQSGAPTSTVGVIMVSCVKAVCEALIRHEEELNALDRGSGDGDCGSTLRAGAEGLQRAISQVAWDEPREALLSMANAVGVMGGSSGAIYNLFLSAGAVALGNPNAPLSWATAMKAGMDAIMKYGWAQLGDRTMLDALSPAVELLLKKLPEGDTKSALREAAEAARTGAEATVTMKARAGRASYVHESQLTQQDPGARAVAVWMEALSAALC